MKYDNHELMSAMVKKLSQEEGSKLTGYMQQKGSYIIHLLEGEGHVIDKFIRYLVNESKKEKTIYIGINILALNEENPKRFYETWLYEGPFPFAPVMELDKSDQQIRDRLWAIYQLFCNAGNKTKGVRDARNLKLVNEVALSNEDVFMLLQKNFMSIVDYSNLYLKDLEIDLDNEHVYPYPISLTSVLEFSDIGYLTNLVDKLD